MCVVHDHCTLAVTEYYAEISKCAAGMLTVVAKAGCDHCDGADDHSW